MDRRNFIKFGSILGLFPFSKLLKNSENKELIFETSDELISMHNMDAEDDLIKALTAEIDREIINDLRCHSFFDFCKEEIELYNPVMGKLSFELYDYQKRLIETCENNRFVIGSKFRQGGFTTTITTWLLWKCLTQSNINAAYFTKTDRACQDVMRDLEFSLKNKEGLKIQRRGIKEIEFAKTNSRLSFVTPEACRGRVIDYLFIDEAAFIHDMDIAWKIIYPAAANAKSIVILSTRTSDSRGKWFEQMLTESAKGKNKFSCFFAHYKEHPVHNTDAWEKEVRKNLGEKSFRQEMEQLL